MPRSQACALLSLLLHSFMLAGVSSGRNTRMWTPLEDNIVGGTIDAGMVVHCLLCYADEILQ